jgi:hypothetical protein
MELISKHLEFIFKHFGKLWLLAFIVGLLGTIGTITLLACALLAWKLVYHFTATPEATAFVSNVLPYLS